MQIGVTPGIVWDDKTPIMKTSPPHLSWGNQKHLRSTSIIFSMSGHIVCLWITSESTWNRSGPIVNDYKMTTIAMLYNVWVGRIFLSRLTILASSHRLRAVQHTVCYSGMLQLIFGGFCFLLKMTSSNGIFPRYWPFVRGQRQGTQGFDVSLICNRINGSVNNGEAGDLRRHRAHYDVTVMCSGHRCDQ